MDEQGGYEGMPFFGLLDEQEQEYFRGADEMLKTDAFGTEEGEQSQVVD